MQRNKILFLLFCIWAIGIIGCADDKKDDSDGANLRFIKLNTQGKALSDTASSWQCVRDKEKGLVWEVKENNTGLRYSRNDYSWYNTNPDMNGGNSGSPNGGGCTGSDCDTQSYVNAVNNSKLCGFNDWRLPTIAEMKGLTIKLYKDVNLDIPGYRTIDEKYFPSHMDEEGGYYWSGDTNPNGPKEAMNYKFVGGYEDSNPKTFIAYVLLVCG